MIKRQRQSDLMAMLDVFPAVCLLGPRQAGKTTLARTVGDSRPSVYLDCENPLDLEKLHNPQDYFTKHADKLIILDEVQRFPDLFQILRGTIDENRRQGKKSGSFLLLGSASIELIKQSGESLAGRIAYLELPSLHLLECGLEHLDQLWSRGGFPESYLATTDQTSLIWRNNFIRTYLERDIPQLGPRIPAETLRRFWTMLAHVQGNRINAAQLASSLAVDGKTIARYLELLVDLLLVRLLRPWHANVGKRLVKSPKIMLRDSGIAHALLNIQDHESLLSHPINGASWEAFAIENIIAVLSPESQYHFYRTHSGAEIDLLITLPDQTLWAVEIKRSTQPKPEKGFYVACEDLQVARRLVVYPGKDHYTLPHGVEIMGLALLMQELLDMNSR